MRSTPNSGFGLHQVATSERGEALYAEDEMHFVFATEAIKRSKQLPKIMSEIVKETQEAREALREAITGLGQTFESVKPMKGYITDEIRMMRMLATSEMKIMMTAFGEVRQFFLGKDHEEEIRRLKEFIDLCERLKKLKDSGFLDTVVDTIIKLS